MTADRPTEFELQVEVSPRDIDELGHVNNVVYLQWIQDAAIAHWRAAATPEQQGAILWFAVRHEIDYLTPAVEGDELLIRTWVQRWKGATSERHTEILRVGDDETVSRAQTRWCAIDPESRRPRRVGVDVRTRFVTNDS